MSKYTPECTKLHHLNFQGKTPSQTPIATCGNTSQSYTPTPTPMCEHRFTPLF